MYFVFLQFTLAVCQEFSSNVNIAFGNLKRRNQIPLSQINRRFSDHLSYRKTKDIRDEEIERRKEESIGDDIIFDRETDDVIFDKRDGILVRKRDDFDRRRDAMDKTRDLYDRKRDEGLLTQNRDAMDKTRDLYDRKRNEGLLTQNRDKILHKNRDESFDRQREDIWDRRDETFDRKREETLDRQRYDAMYRKRDKILDRRFEQSEREANRLENTNGKLESLHQDLKWLTVNTDGGMGIGI